MYLTARSPLASRFLAWVHERFPLPNALLFFALYASALLLGRGAAGDGAAGSAMRVGAIDVVGFLAIWSFFLLLRVLDEHKDFETDSVNHPQRVLQSGLITLGHLKVVGVLAAALGLAVSLAHDGGVGRVTLAWAAMTAWTLLMAKEFFVGEWLAKRLVLYAFSHMLVMPLLLLWMVQMGAGRFAPPADTAALAAMAFFAGASFEVARKTRAPADERDGVDSYTKSLGLRGAPAALAVVQALCGASFALVLRGLFSGAVPAVAWAVGGVGLALGFAAIGAFVRRPTAKAAKAVEAAVGISMLVLYGTLIVCEGSRTGLAWR
jgi:4-hydroxybenzoate polyprenyltransferase